MRWGFCILHSASILPPQTAPHPAFGFWILDSEEIWLPLRWGAILGILEVGKLSFWILVARSGAGLAILETVFWETELEFEI